jgi:hypothetical protein
VNYQTPSNERDLVDTVYFHCVVSIVDTNVDAPETTQATSESLEESGIIVCIQAWHLFIQQQDEKFIGELIHCMP